MQSKSSVLHQLTTMQPVSPAEAKALLSAVCSPSLYHFKPPSPANRVEKDILKQIGKPEKPEYYTESPSATGEVPERLRPHVKCLRIRSSEIYDACHSKNYLEEKRNVTLAPTPFSRRVTKTLGDERNVVHSWMPADVRERRLTAARVEAQELDILQKDWPKEMVVRQVLRIVNPFFPYLICCPDGVVFHSGVPVGLVEVKSTHGSAFVYKGERQIEVREEKKRLVPRSRTWYQIQASLAITNLPWCILVSHSIRDNRTVRVKVERDERAIGQILSDMYKLYCSYNLPLMSEVAKNNGIN